MTNAKFAGKAAMLRSLVDSPSERRAYALRIVESETNPELLLAALRVLGEYPDSDLRPALLVRYTYCNAKGVRRDQGGVVRAAILEVLRSVLLPEDADMLVRATTTYEFLYGEAAGDLRAAGLLALNELDETLAAYHAVRLLDDEHTSTMSGEPAVAAVRVLASQEQFLPLYGYVVRAQPGEPDVVAECLRNLVRLPNSLLPALIERYYRSENEIELLGLFDLILGRPCWMEHIELIFGFLRDTHHHNIYRYLVNTLLTGADEAVLECMRSMVAVERDIVKAEILREALELRRRS